MLFAVCADATSDLAIGQRHLVTWPSACRLLHALRDPRSATQMDLHNPAAVFGLLTYLASYSFFVHNISVFHQLYSAILVTALLLSFKARDSHLHFTQWSKPPTFALLVAFRLWGQVENSGFSLCFI